MSKICGDGRKKLNKKVTTYIYLLSYDQPTFMYKTFDKQKLSKKYNKKITPFGEGKNDSLSVCFSLTLCVL